MIILLNGASSAGKSSIARELQKILEGPYLHVSLDAFMNMIPWDRVQTSSQEKRDVVLGSLLKGFHASIAALELCGNDLIVDHVLVPQMLPQCVEALYEFNVVFIGVHCQQEELQRREFSRTDRGPFPEAADWQFHEVHKHCIYDFEVDTTSTSPAECALQIKGYLEDAQTPTAFRRLKASLGQPNQSG